MQGVLGLRVEIPVSSFRRCKPGKSGNIQTAQKSPALTATAAHISNSGSGSDKDVFNDIAGFGGITGTDARRSSSGRPAL